MKPLDLMKVLTPARRGSVAIERFTVTEHESRMSALRGALNYVDAGEYLRLTINGATVMSNTRMEQGSNGDCVYYAKGRVLLGGLGLGYVLSRILPRPEVEHVTVVEVNSNVIALVALAFERRFKRKLTVVQGDIRTWTPPEGAKYDTIYFDIWSTICTDNLPEMAALHQRYKQYKASRDAWMQSWSRDILKSELRRERAYGFGY